MWNSLSRVIIFLLVFYLAGYLLYDGLHAFATGNYAQAFLEAGDNPYAAKWMQLVQGLGINPIGTFMKSIHVLWGLWGLWALSLFTFNVWGSRWNLFFYCICCLWYMSFGSILAVLAMLFLFFMRSK